jgi:hypothetical protein
MPIGQHPSMVSVCACHPTATVVVILIATEGKAPASNVFARVTLMTLVTVDCGCYLDGGGGYVFHRRWISSIVQSLQSGTRSTGSCGGLHHCHHVWRESGLIAVGIHVCLLLWLWREPRGAPLYLGDGGDGGDENHNPLGGFTAADRTPTGGGAFSRTGCRDRSGEVPCRCSRPTVGSGQGGLRVLQMWPKSGGVPAVLGGATISL